MSERELKEGFAKGITLEGKKVKGIFQKNKAHSLSMKSVLTLEF